MVKLYFDADVWLNFCLDEMPGFVLASHYTEQLLGKVVDERWVIVISETVKEEVFEKNITPSPRRLKAWACPSPLCSRIFILGIFFKVSSSEASLASLSSSAWSFSATVFIFLNIIDFMGCRHFKHNK
jgi:hypothetical protein